MGKLTLGDRIKFIRKDKNLSQSDFGKSLIPTANKSVVSRWESNTNVPSEDRLKQIADMGDVSVDYLKNGSIDADELKNAFLESETPSGVGKKFNVIRDFSFDSAASIDLNRRIIKADTHEAINKLTTNHYQKFNDLTTDSKATLLQVIKLIDLFEKDSVEDNDEYSYALNELLEAINEYTHEHTNKNKNAAKAALNKVLQSLKHIDLKNNH